eukprot:CAMPEP_0175808806 /NCGR_PEP_ID=MMETSP0107_2-20121207/2457_1 /TAXON_ID=195067 ORGANISM="Goniomonas pacifica, Strain CCMP1869" /NCGR_SAMPLE_ID=MMETSP0107_2 /ASSEMBLY_ACC=CAM_ASM_000203 /LENGTH=72 /DNA_ID=CAMNT_0017120461 /DNA_START=75 /DNA_END=293 /DNA_ORIENTATION=+
MAFTSSIDALNCSALEAGRAKLLVDPTSRYWGSYGLDRLSGCASSGSRRIDMRGGDGDRRRSCPLSNVDARK